MASLTMIGNILLSSARLTVKRGSAPSAMTINELVLVWLDLVNNHLMPIAPKGAHKVLSPRSSIRRGRVPEETRTPFWIESSCYVLYQKVYLNHFTFICTLIHMTRSPDH